MKTLLYRAMLILLICLFPFACAFGEMPDSLQAINAEAFYGNASMTNINIPAGTERIGDRAFASCASLVKVVIPSSVTTIGVDVFKDSPQVVIHCALDSAAAEYAIQNDIRYVDIDANTYYVDPQGDDLAERNGGKQQPWKTVAYAATRVRDAGAIIHVNEGTYVETQRTYLAPGVSLRDEGNKSIITSDRFSQDGWLGIVNLMSDSIVDGDQSITELRFDGAALTVSQALEIRNRNNVTVSNCEFEDFNYSAVGWRAYGVGPEAAPSAYVTGGVFSHNKVHNCAGNNAGWYRGALLCGGLDGFLIHHNNMVEDERARGMQGWPIKFWYYSGWMRNCKIYNNYIAKTDTSNWPFAIESDHHAGLEIYGNTIIGAIDLNYSEATGGTGYGTHIHDNIIGPATTNAGAYTGIILEFTTNSVMIEDNDIRNCNAAIVFTPRTCDITDVTIRNNDCTLLNAGFYNEVMRVSGAGLDQFTGDYSPTPVHITNLAVTGNEFVALPGQVCYFGITINWDIEDGYHWAGNGVTVSENTFNGFTVNWLQLRKYDELKNLRVENNTIINCGTPNGPVFDGDVPADAVINQ